MSAGVQERQRVSLVHKGLTEQSGQERKDYERALRKARGAISRQLQESLRYVGLEMQAHKLEDCGKVWVKACGDCGGTAARPLYRCEFKLCPWCLWRKGLQRADELTPYVAAFENAIHITLTVKNGEDLRERDNHLRTSYKKLVRRSLWKQAIRTAFVFWEDTFNVDDETHHPHLHILADGWIDQAELASEWEQITQDSRIVYVQQLKGGVEGVREACKYPIKSDQMAGNPRALLDYLEAMQGRRMFWTYGYPKNNWRASKRVEVEVPEEDAIERAAAESDREVTDVCPHCGAVDKMIEYRGGGGRRRWWNRQDVRAVAGGWYVLDE